MSRDFGDAKSPTGSSTILHIDDQLWVPELVSFMLRNRPGLSLVKAADGETGLRRAKQLCPDVVLLDLYLPDMSGNEVLRRLQEDPATQDIPVIVISGDASRNRFTQLREAGARGFLAKPVDEHSLVAILDEVLGATELDHPTNCDVGHSGGSKTHR